MQAALLAGSEISTAPTGVAGIFMSESGLVRLMVTGIVLLLAEPIAAHSIKHDETTIDYEGLLGGSEGKTPCCDGRHCQPALAWRHEDARKLWKFTVRWGNAHTEVEVPEVEVTYQDLKGKGIAHWCGEFIGGESQGYINRCAFVPLKLY